MALNSLLCADVPLRNCSINQPGKIREFVNSGKLKEFKIYSGNLSDVCIIVSNSTLNWLSGTVTGVDRASHHAP